MLNPDYAPEQSLLVSLGQARVQFKTAKEQLFRCCLDLQQGTADMDAVSRAVCDFKVAEAELHAYEDACKLLYGEAAEAA